MPVPTSINDLSTTAASNSPAGSETPTEGDNYIRTLSAFIASLRDKLNGTAATGTVKDATFSGTMAGAASWAALQTFAAGLGVGNVAQASSTTLDWYEEGTFTPDLSFTGGSTGITYATQLGYYTRIGNVVAFEIYITLTSKGSSTGSARINTMPFAQANLSVPFAAYVSSSGVTGTVVARLGVASAGQTRLDLWINEGSGFTALTDADLTNTSTIMVSGTYRVQ